MFVTSWEELIKLYNERKVIRCSCYTEVEDVKPEIYDEFNINSINKTHISLTRTDKHYDAKIPIKNINFNGGHWVITHNESLENIRAYLIMTRD